MCKAFQHIESNQRQTMNYKVTNDCIAIWAEYENDSDWDVLRGKIFLQQLLHQYRLHLLSYDMSNVIMSCDRFWEKKKKTVEYKFPSNLEKFDLRIFHYDVAYLNYGAISLNFNFNYHKMF